MYFSWAKWNSKLEFKLLSILMREKKKSVCPQWMYSGLIKPVWPVSDINVRQSVPAKDALSFVERIKGSTDVYLTPESMNWATYSLCRNIINWILKYLHISGSSMHLHSPDFQGLIGLPVPWLSCPKVPGCCKTTELPCGNWLPYAGWAWYGPVLTNKTKVQSSANTFLKGKKCD